MKFYKGIVAFIDIIIINIAFAFALALRFEGIVPKKYINMYIHTFFVLVLINSIVFMVLGLYRSLWEYASIKEMFKVALANLIVSCTFYTYTEFTNQIFPRSIFIIYGLIALSGTGGIRICYRLLRRFKKLIYLYKETAFDEKEQTKRVMFIGAGDAAALVIHELKKQTYPDKRIIVAVDDAPTKMGATIHGIPITGPIENIKKIARDYIIDEIIIAIPSASRKRIAEIVTLCNETNCELKIFPGVGGALKTSFALTQLRTVSIEDLLGREEIEIDNSLLSTHIQDKIVMVTGGGGSIGSELCRQIVKFKPYKLIIFDIYENNAYDLQNELLRKGIPPSQLEVIIGSVTDIEKLRQVFHVFSPNVVFHAAAYKHVPLMETNPSEAIKNNVYGTLNTAICAKEYRVEKFILISTDKAVNPTNVMGASKRLCEMIIQGISQTNTTTQFAAVRFGNVLGSNGSVIPLFKKQLEEGGPITVTHEDIIRYFMTIPEAVRLILQAATFAKSGEIFILDMGDPVKIMDLAKNFIKLSGMELGKDVEIEITGLRPGEKLYEELLMSEEGLSKTSCDKIFIGQPMIIDFDQFIKEIKHLGQNIYNEKLLKQKLRILVPTYKPAQDKTSVLSREIYLPVEGNVNATPI